MPGSPEVSWFRSDLAEVAGSRLLWQMLLVQACSHIFAWLQLTPWDVPDSDQAPQRSLTWAYFLRVLISTRDAQAQVTGSGLFL